MKKLMICLMTMVCAVSMTVGAQVLKSRTADKTNGSKIAIYVSGDADTDFEEAIAAEFTNWLNRVPCFTLLARDGGCLNAMIAEQNYQVSGNVSESQISQIGEQFGADYVLDVNVKEFNNTVVFNVRIMNVETGKIIYTTKLQNKVRKAEDVLGLAGRCAHKVYQDYQNRKKIE